MHFCWMLIFSWYNSQFSLWLLFFFELNYAFDAFNLSAFDLDAFDADDFVEDGFGSTVFVQSNVIFLFQYLVGFKRFIMTISQAQSSWLSFQKILLLALEAFNLYQVVPFIFFIWILELFLKYLFRLRVNPDWLRTDKIVLLTNRMCIFNKICCYYIKNESNDFLFGISEHVHLCRAQKDYFLDKWTCSLISIRNKWTCSLN